MEYNICLQKNVTIKPIGNEIYGTLISINVRENKNNLIYWDIYIYISELNLNKI